MFYEEVVEMIDHSRTRSQKQCRKTKSTGGLADVMGPIVLVVLGVCIFSFGIMGWKNGLARSREPSPRTLARSSPVAPHSPLMILPVAMGILMLGAGVRLCIGGKSEET